jgi:hypothetical protein
LWWSSPTDQAISLRRCPSYVEVIGSSPALSKESYALNCAGAAAIQAYNSVQFEMRIHVPAEASAGPSEVHWSLAGPELAEAKADVTIAWCLDHKRSWCERTAASAWSEDDFAIRLSRDEALVLSDWPKLFALTTVALGSWCFSRVVGPAGVLRAEEYPYV